MRDITLRPILYISEPYSPWENSTTQQNIQVDTCKSPETRCPDGLGARSGEMLMIGTRTIPEPIGILERTLHHAPPKDALLHGRVRLCRSCGCETSNDRICDNCARALREERAAALGERCRVHRVQYVEDLPPRVLKAHRDEWEGS